MVLKNNQGFSLIELMLSLFLGSLVLLAAWQIFYLIFKDSLNLAEQTRLRRKLLLLESSLKQELSRSRNYFGLKTSFIQSDFFNTESSAKSGLKSRFAPLPNSQGLSIQKLGGEFLKRLPADKALVNSSAELYCRILPQGQVKPPLSKYWLGLTQEGPQSFNALSLVRSCCSTLCPRDLTYRVQLKPAKESLWYRAESTAPALLLIPIEEELTFYVDRQQTLRRFSHLSEDNQPLLEGIKEFRLSEKQFAYSLQLELSARSRLEFKREVLLPKPLFFPEDYFDLLEVSY